MTAKRRWIKKVYSSQSQETNIRNDISISWSSSEEDEIPLKKLKPATTVSARKCSEWIKHCNKSFYNKITTQAPPHPGNHVIFTGSTSSKQIDSDDSPIINKTNEWSPVLTQNKSSTEKTSPVLNKRRVVRKVKCRLNEELKMSETETVPKDQQIADDSSDLFSTQPSQAITIAHDDSHSDLLVKQCTQVVIEDTQISVKTLDKIEPLASQDSSEIPINSHSDKVSSNSEEYLLNYKQQPPVRRKRYKRGGLCSQLQRVVRTQKARVAIWQHERLLNKNDSFLIENKNSFCFCIKKQWKEYGCILCECVYSDNKKSEITEASHSGSVIMTEEIFVLVLGFNVIPNIRYVTDSKYILYPPFSKKGIVYKNRIAHCYFNVSKIQKCKMK